MEAILGKWKEEAYVLMRIMMGFMILREIVHESGLIQPNISSLNQGDPA
jgi:hypothetical protein